MNAHDQFPGFRQCMEMMRSRDGITQEVGFHWLRLEAEKSVEPLIAEFRSEQDHGLKCWLLELIGTTASTKAFDLLAEHLSSEDDSLRFWAIEGLRRLDTPKARAVLLKSGVEPAGD